MLRDLEKISHSCSRCFSLCLLKRFNNRLNRKVVGWFLRCWRWSPLLLWQECHHNSQLKDDMPIKSHQSSLPAALQTPTTPILVLVHCTERDADGGRKNQQESRNGNFSGDDNMKVCSIIFVCGWMKKRGKEPPEERKQFHLWLELSSQGERRNKKRKKKNLFTQSHQPDESSRSRMEKLVAVRISSRCYLLSSFVVVVCFLQQQQQHHWRAPHHKQSTARGHPITSHNVDENGKACKQSYEKHFASEQWTHIESHPFEANYVVVQLN